MALFLPSLHILSPLSPRKTFFPPWVFELGFLALLLCQESVHHFFDLVKNWRISTNPSLKTMSTMSFNLRRSLQSKVEREAAQIPDSGTTIFDLPELDLDCILEKLPPAELCKMVAVCRYLKERCVGDHLWKRHMREKWSRVIGEAALRKWELQIEPRRDFEVRSEKPAASYLRRLPWLKRKADSSRTSPADSLISFYQALENGGFSFPAQVFNRENGNAGFLLSCYDAEISYSYRKNKFYARYPPHGKRVPAVEEVPWERIRAPSVSTSAHDLHISVCLNDLNPGDHIEIQWRRNKEFPYGWWYAVVGHLEGCDRDDHHCFCHESDTLVLEFNHYPPDSRWRKKIIDRREHSEDGSEDDGFYGGIRKLERKEEISIWKQFWPAEAVE
ncbi:F-box protein [Platanthera zijinensis]|uniref:F-box protein n=1 Tax=Platanthera zijinensis TaxID=2320716 RepID=A0AAP0BKG8_9ASPA